MPHNFPNNLKKFGGLIIDPAEIKRIVLSPNGISCDVYLTDGTIIKGISQIYHDFIAAHYKE